MRFLSFLMVVGTVIVSMAGTSLSEEALERKPAILFVTPNVSSDTSHAYVDWNWLNELHEAGFEVDVRDEDGMEAMTWERVRHFNVLFLYSSPDALLRQWQGRPSDAEKVRVFQEILRRFTAAGGGLFLMPTEHNIRKQALADATAMMDVRLPAECIVEENPNNLAFLSHAAMPTPLAWTDVVEKSPVSAGVRGIWYPFAERYSASQMNPLEVSADWQVVVRTSPTARTLPVHGLREEGLTGYDIRELENLYYREEGERQPALFAIRDWNGGRVAICPMWRMFSVASGTQWIFNREVLERGFGNRPSDFNRLLHNTFRWLAEPSLRAGAEIGGYVTTRALVPKNEREGAFERFRKQFAPGKYDNQPPAGAKMYKGLIGARTAFTAGGSGSLAEYARAARGAGLDYVVFLEELNDLTPASWQLFSEECQAHSDAALLLIPGMSGRNNLGNFMFLYGQGLPFPMESGLIRNEEGRRLFYIQAQNAKGQFTPNHTPLFSWLLDVAKRYQIGYGDFASSPRGMTMEQLRLCGSAAVEFYRNGELVESLLDEYLATAQGTLAPSPLAVNRVNSPGELQREVAAGRGIVHAQAGSLETLMAQALRYTSQYDGVNVFPSTGPIIDWWPATARAFSFGSEEYVVESNLMQAPLRVSAAAGLAEVSLYNGRELFRRFLPGGVKEFAVDLVLDRVLQRNVVAVVTDLQGGRAVSFPRRSWKEGSPAPIFCSDHINDMTRVALARGPIAATFLRPPPVPEGISGFTWDGGPKGTRPFFEFSSTFPVLKSNLGKESAINMLQTPLLVACDELSARTASERLGETYGDGGISVFNPWRTFGPQGGGEAQLFTCYLEYHEWGQPMAMVNASGWGFGGERTGLLPARWRAEIRYRQAQTVEELQLALMHASMKNAPAPAFVVMGEDLATSIDLTSLKGVRRVRLATGSWMGLYSSRLMNAHLLFNRGADLLVELREGDARRNAGPGMVFLADNAGAAVEGGQRDFYDVGFLNFPVDADPRGPAELGRYADYLANLPGLELAVGSREVAPGALRIAAVNGVADLKLSRDSAPPMMTVPLEVSGLNPRWSAGLLQRQGYVKGYYGDGSNRWRPLALAPDGDALAPLFVTLAPVTDVAAGHPVIADENGKQLFIQVTCTGSNPARWHVSVNNPTDAPVKTILRQALAAPGLAFAEQSVELAAGEYRVIHEDEEGR